MTDNLELQMDAYLPLRDVVFQTLRGAILKGDLKPGERLMELQLASKLGVSRTPIREAIRMLEQEGLAVTIPRKGAEVAKMTEKDMEDVLEIRLSLEGLAVRLSCEKITPAALQELKVAMEDFEEKTNQKFPPLHCQYKGNAIFMKLTSGSDVNLKPDLVISDFFRYCHHDVSPYAYQIHRLQMHFKEK